MQGLQQLPPPSCFDVLDSWRAKYSNYFWMAENGAAQSAPTPIEEVVLTYSEAAEGYSSMNQDTVRNTAYQHGINQAITQGAKHWIEIGCGAHLCLTKNILNHGDGSTTVVAIEANEDAVPMARHGARLAGHTKRFTLLEGLSTDASVMEEARTRAPYAI